MCRKAMSTRALLIRSGGNQIHQAQHGWPIVWRTCSTSTDVHLTAENETIFKVDDISRSVSILI